MSSLHVHTNGYSRGGAWIFTLFATEGIPSALVTFVALLIFLQQDGITPYATLYASILWFPWAMKSWMRSWIRRAGHYRRTLHIFEFLMAASLAILAFTIPLGTIWTLCTFFFISLLTAGHSLAARMYYERMLRPPLQRLYNGYKMAASQIAVIITYGMMITIVGVLQIYFRQKSLTYSWSLASYIASGVMFLFTFLHIFSLQTTHVESQYRTNTVSGSLRSEFHILERISQRQDWWRHVLLVFLALIPQGLMFGSRVLFFYDKTENGGLGCTLQEIGFAQGTIGVIAFWAGLMIGRFLLRYIPFQRLFWPLLICLGCSPLIYLFMSIEPPASLATLCIATFQAQLLFGFGLNACRNSIRYISDERYRNTTNYLYIPLISLCMIPTIAISGWLIQTLGYHYFFLLDSISAPFSWFIIKLITHKL